jgi:hypothetical protein
MDQHERLSDIFHSEQEAKKKLQIQEAAFSSKAIEWI